MNGNDDHDLTMVQQVSQVPRILREIKKRFFERMGFSFGSSISDIGNIVTISYLLALEVARQKAE
jgi:hypothetical protein